MTSTVSPPMLAPEFYIGNMGRPSNCWATQMANMILSQRGKAITIADEARRYQIVRSIEKSLRHAITLGHYESIIELLKVATASSDRPFGDDIRANYSNNPMRRSVKTKNPTPQSSIFLHSQRALETARTETLATVMLLLGKATGNPICELWADSLHRHELHSALKALERISGDMIKLLLTEETNINAQDRLGRTPLYYSVEIGNDTVINLLLENARTDPNIVDHRGRSPLHLAASQTTCSCIVVQALVSRGANLDAPDTYGSTPLHLLMQHFGHGSDKMIKLLLEWGASTTAQDLASRTPLHYAGYLTLSHLRIIKLLLSYKADINSLDNHLQTPLHLALGKTKNLTTATILLNLGAIANTEDSFGSSPLHSILKSSEVDLEDIIKLLVTKGADVNKKDRDGQTPLHVAIDRGHEAVTEFLLDSRAEINALDNELRTPLHLATGGTRTIATAASLLRRGAQVNALDSSGSSPLHSATRSSGPGSEKMIKLLLESGANPKAQDKSGVTPLHSAASSAGLESVAILLDAGAHVNALDASFSTPLHLAPRLVGVGNPEEVVRLLLARGAKKVINAKDQHGFRPLHLAVHTESSIIASLLITNGADINAINYYGETALDIAIKFQSPGQTIEKFLIAKGARCGSGIRPELEAARDSRIGNNKESLGRPVVGADAKGVQLTEMSNLKPRRRFYNPFA